MTADERSHNEQMLDTNRKRLRVLELQAAQFGIYAPPHIVTEIEDLKQEINRLQNILGTTQDSAPSSQSSTSTRTIPSKQRAFSSSEMTRLVDLLLAAPSFAERSTRESILQLIPTYISNSIVRNGIARVDVLNILRTSLNYPDGLDELLEALRWFEGDSLPMQKIDSFIASL